MIKYRIHSELTFIKSMIRLFDLYMVILGFWNGKMVVYPYDQNDFQLRSHHEFVAAAKEAQEQSTEKRMKSVNGIKGLSCLLEIMSYPQQIVLDYMHLVCLGHVQTLIRKWTTCYKLPT